MKEPQRIAKLLARAGIASRREIERMIEDHRVAIAGKAIETPATLLTSLQGVTVDGKPVAEPEATRLFLYHKPAGVLTAARDTSGRPTIYDRMPAGLPRVMPVGRLDLNTEGLLLLTTDGEFKRSLELPANGVERVYRARAYGPVTQADLEALSEGIEIEGVRYGSIDANIERRTGANVWIEMRLREGKNREVRRVLEHLGLTVNRLIRVAYGPFILADLPIGEAGEVRQNDLVTFRKNLRGSSREGPTIAASPMAPTPNAAPVEETPKAPPTRADRPTRGSQRTRPTEGAPGGRSPRPTPVRQDRTGARGAAPTGADRDDRSRRNPRERAAAAGAEPAFRSDRHARPDDGAPARRRTPAGAPVDRPRADRPDRARPDRKTAGRPARAERDERPYSGRSQRGRDTAQREGRPAPDRGERAARTPRSARGEDAPSGRSREGGFEAPAPERGGQRRTGRQPLGTRADAPSPPRPPRPPKGSGPARPGRGKPRRGDA